MLSSRAALAPHNHTVMPSPTFRSPLVLGLAVVAALAAALWWFTQRGGDGTPNFKTAKIERGPIVAAVAATGTLNAVVTVQVGSQVSGQIRELLADFNTPVKKNQVIARIDPATFELRVNQGRADVEAALSAVAVARANLVAQQAQLGQAQVNLVETQRDLERKESLIARGFLSPAERDKARTALDAAREQIRSLEAQNQVAAAQVDSALAQVKQRESALRQAQVDLERTYIRAPVDGTVISRTVDAGQTVAASLQAPTLFTIAQDLRQMQVEAAIDEADVGRLSVGQTTSFTVDAFPRRTFSGEVKQIRKAAQTVQNVVTYTVVITAGNPDLRLLPGMTANVRIVTDRRDTVLKVPNAALRFRPPNSDGGRGDGAAPSASAPGGAQGNQPSRERALPDQQGSRAATGRVYQSGAGSEPKAVDLKLGLSDGSVTEITAGPLKEGDEVVIGLVEAPKRSTAGGPRMF